MRVIPAILVNTAEELIQQVDKLSSYFQSFQIDIADGEFVPKKTISLAEAGDALSRITVDKMLTIDFDLMINDVAGAINEIDKLSQKLKVGTIFIHNLNVFNPRPNLGIAIDPQIAIETIIQRFDLNTLPAIQIMSVIPGAQDRAFIPETLNKIERLRKAGYRNKIYLDGGINEKSLVTILEKQFRPDILCIGSYLTRAENLEERVSKLRQI